MNQEYLTASEKLSAFLDGELEVSEASTLFYEIAQKPELQEEMKQHVSIRKMMSGSQVSPPAHLKDNILKSAGLTGIGAAAGFGAGSILRIFFNRTVLMVTSAVVASLVTFSVMNNSGGSSAPNELPGNTINKANSINYLSDRNLEKAEMDIQVPVMKSISEDRSSVSKNNIIAASETDNIENKTTTNFSESSQDIDSRNEFEFYILNNDIKTDQNIQIADNSQDLTYVNGEPGIKSVTRTIEIPTNRTVFMIRGFAARSMPEIDIESNIRPSFNNMALGMLYRLDSDNAVGFEIGQENMMQKYSGFSVKKQRHVSVEQNYLVLWYGLTYQHVFEDETGVEPFVRLFAGGTKIGPMTRGILGLKYSYQDRFGMFAGLEGTLLGYRFDGTWFGTGKFGFTYGMEVKF